MALNSGSFHLLPLHKGELFELPLRRFNRPVLPWLGGGAARANDFRLESVSKAGAAIHKAACAVAVSSAWRPLDELSPSSFRALLDVDLPGRSFVRWFWSSKEPAGSIASKSHRRGLAPIAGWQGTVPMP